MTGVSSLSETVTALASTFTGQLLLPGDADYDEARKVHNGLIDKRPALIARCRGLADIVDAVNMARDQKLEVAVRGGGHNVAGRATIDRGMVIDLSLMKGIHVDPKARTARAQGGLTWNEFNRETQLHGLATTGGVVSTTGIAGLTLGGGLGWLMGKHALALDNLLSIDLVLADGKILTVGEGDYVELPRRRRIRRFRRRCLWTELSTPAGAQSEIRSAELFPRESEHPSAGVNRLIRG